MSSAAVPGLRFIGTTRSRELTESPLARVDAVTGTVNAMVELRREAARREAVAADAAIARGGPAGPLHGVPISAREALNVAGMHDPGATQRSASLSPTVTPLWSRG
jgi:amidase